MDPATPTVADVFRRYGDTYRDHVGPSLPVAHRRVLTAITACRTAALGGHVEQCDDCRYRRVLYLNNSRHPTTTPNSAGAGSIARSRT